MSPGTGLEGALQRVLSPLPALLVPLLAFPSSVIWLLRDCPWQLSNQPLGEPPAQQLAADEDHKCKHWPLCAGDPQYITGYTTKILDAEPCWEHVLVVRGV